MNKALVVVKYVGGFVVSVGIGAVAANLVKVTTPKDTIKVVKACINVGGWAIAGIASAVASNQFEDKVDMIVNIVNKMKAKFNKPEEVIEK